MVSEGEAHTWPWRGRVPFVTSQGTLISCVFQHANVSKGWSFLIAAELTGVLLIENTGLEILRNIAFSLC